MRSIRRIVSSDDQFLNKAITRMACTGENEEDHAQVIWARPRN